MRPDQASITGLILAGGRGTRMAGADKGLQTFNGQRLIDHALQRLTPQVAITAINANRHLPIYQALDVAVWPDKNSNFEGPLAGFLVGLENAATPYVLTVPCDTPFFPMDLAQRLATALHDKSADMAMVSAPSPAEPQILRKQPTFCLMHTRLQTSLKDFLAKGGRKIADWASQHTTVLVPFDWPHDALDAFSNLNTPEELQALAQSRVKRV